MGAENKAPSVTQAVIAATPTPVLAAEPVVEEKILPPDPTRLVGLNPAEVQSLMGAPSLVRRDANVQMMLFENGDCVFEVVFYEPSPDEYFTATTINARTTSGTDIDQTACLTDILPDGLWIGDNK